MGCFWEGLKNVNQICPTESLVFTGNSFSPVQIPGAITGLHLSANGEKLFLADSVSGNGKIFQYTLGSAFDISTASYDSKFMSFSGEVSNTSVDFTMSENGFKVYIVNDFQSYEIFQYTLSTAFDISTASYDSKLLNTSAQMTMQQGISISLDGLTAFVVDANDYTAKVFQYSLSVAFDISTATYSSKFLYYGAEAPQANGLHVSSDGLTVTLKGNYNNLGTWLQIFQYSLSVPNDLSTASFKGTYFDVGLQQQELYGIVLRGNNVYTGDFNGATVRQYEIN